MNFTNQNTPGWVFIGILLSLGWAIFWMVVGWRAMRAHERIAESSERALRNAREREKRDRNDFGPVP